MRRDYRGREAECTHEIIDGDKIDIINSDIILVNAIRPSWGTGMECLYAHQHGKTIIIVCPSDKPSPWLVGHSDFVCKSFDEAFKRLQELM
jgi:hypothetical protein